MHADESIGMPRPAAAASPHIRTLRSRRQNLFDDSADVSFVSLPMQLTKQQKIVGAVLVLAVAAFAVDRWVIGHEGDTVAASSRASSATGAGRRPAARPVRAAAVAAAPEASLGNLAGLATRLSYIARSEDLDPDSARDAFRPPAAWVGTTRVATPDEVALAAREFQNRRLTAVMRKTGRDVAIVDQRTVAVGQSLDGFLLVAVRDRSAVFRRGSQRVELRLPEEPGGTGQSTSEKMAGTDPSS